jgi:phosphomannomutase
MTNFIFDVDGTLTPSRGRIDPEFHDFFLDFCRRFIVYIVTGSDIDKTREQIGDEILNTVTISFQCAGNSNWAAGRKLYEYIWEPPSDLISFLKEKLIESRYKPKTGNHIDNRDGMINFSVVGRNATIQDRHLYRQWDEHKRERKNIAREIMDKFPNIQAQVAGETGIDIYEVGRDKAQVAEWIQHPILFFGDKMQIGGNDYPLMKRLETYPKSKSIQVKDWKDTYRYLQAVTNSV